MIASHAIAKSACFLEIASRIGAAQGDGLSTFAAARTSFLVRDSPLVKGREVRELPLEALGDACVLLIAVLEYDDGAAWLEHLRRAAQRNPAARLAWSA